MNTHANPWNRSKPNSNRQSGPNLKKVRTPAETKFQEAQKKLQEAVQKHIKDYDSSSDEDGVESSSVISKPLTPQIIDCSFVCPSFYFEKLRSHWSERFFGAHARVSRRERRLRCCHMSDLYFKNKEDGSGQFCTVVSKSQANA